MDRPHHRPRLEILIRAPRDTVREAFRDRVAHPRCTCEGTLARNHLHVAVGAAQRHFWSPTLDVTLRDHPDGTLLLGRFGPHPNVWTMYVFGYGVCAFAAIVAACWALAQWAIGSPPLALAWLAGSGVAALAVWGSARVGASIGHDQMEQLVRMVDGLGEPIADEAGVFHPDDGPTASADPGAAT